MKEIFKVILKSSSRTQNHEIYEKIRLLEEKNRTLKQKLRKPKAI